MGAVYKARDLRLDRLVAIKRVDSRYLARFRREVRTIGALNHPNTCVLHGRRQRLRVMEYVAGAPLRCPEPLSAPAQPATNFATTGVLNPILAAGAMVLSSLSVIGNSRRL